jgi:peptidoglycan/LPS O-acetylase OafA/YrhL
LKAHRNEIDGLRAFAILPVILFHAGFESFEGGFIGVDIFFVISGYLITNLIINNLNQQSFVLRNFYERRVRRLLPALFVVMLACIPIAWMFMLPSDLKYFGQSLVSVSTFSSNVFFWIKTGYFDSSAELNPLLHTWSLAVEEQYYIIFPLILILVWKRGYLFSVSLIFCTLIVSLLLSNWGSGTFPSFTFYMLPTRAWEILTGALLAIILYKRNEIFNSKLINQFFSLAGLGLIIYSFFIFDSSTPFPSFKTLIPIFGTALIILTANKGTLAFKFLSLGPIVTMGLISYSAYLWHQPILAFARYRLVEDLSLITVFALCSLSIVIAYASWKWLETPFRNPKIVSSRLLLQLTISLIVILVSFGLYLHYSNGALNRVPPDYLATTFYKDLNKVPNKVGLYGKNCVSNLAELCTINSINENVTLLIGDSHSADFSNNFNNFASQKAIGAYQLSMGGCSFMISSFNKNKECQKASLLLRELIELKKVERIIFITNQYKHLSYLTKLEANKNIDYFLHTISAALKNNIQVIYFKPRPSFKLSVARAALMQKLNNPIIVNSRYKNLLDSKIDSIKDENFIVFDQHEIIINKLCNESLDCSGGLFEARPFYSDTNHLSKYGAEYIFSKFNEVFN